MCTTSVSRAASRPGFYVARRLVLALRKARKGGTQIFESNYPSIIATASTTTTPSFVSLTSASSPVRRLKVHLARTIAYSRPFRYLLPRLNKPHTTTAQNRAYLHVLPSAPPAATESVTCRSISIYRLNSDDMNKKRYTTKDLLTPLRPQSATFPVQFH